MHLVFYNDDFFNDVKAYRLDDASFTGVPIEIIEEYKNQDDFYPILCFEEDKLVCFFALDGSANKLVYTDNQNSFLIRAFSTDSNEVRKGYATKSLLALESFVKMNFEGNYEGIRNYFGNSAIFDPVDGKSFIFLRNQSGYHAIFC